MIYSDAIKNGFRLVNGRWQLILVQAAMMLFNCVSFFIVVGIPLGIAFIIFGYDLTGLSEMNDILSLFKNPEHLLTKYFSLILVIAAFILLYIVIVTTAGLYVFSGSAGVLGMGAAEPTRKFSTKDFFSEAKKLFFPMMWYSLVAGLVFVIITFGLGLFGGGIAAIVSMAKGQDSTLALFLGIFFSLVLALTALCLFLIALAATVYGIAVLYYRREGAAKSFMSALRFLRAHPEAFWLYIILLAGYIMLSFLVMLVVYPFYLIPIIGTILSFPFHIAQGYLGLVILAVVLSYYYRTEIDKSEMTTPPEAGSGIEDEEVTSAHWSIPHSDTSPPEAEEPGPAPDQKAGPSQT